MADGPFYVVGWRQEGSNLVPVITHTRSTWPAAQALADEFAECRTNYIWSVEEQPPQRKTEAGS